MYIRTVFMHTFMCRTVCNLQSHRLPSYTTTTYIVEGDMEEHDHFEKT